MSSRSETYSPDENCPCYSGKPFSACCKDFLSGKRKPDTAEQLMRSRYSAYSLRVVKYLVETNHPDTRESTLNEDLEASIADPVWTHLTILSTQQGQSGDKIGKVHFVAEYTLHGKPNMLEERSRFRRYEGNWHYLDGNG